MAQQDEATALIALIGRFERLLDHSGLSELEVEAGDTRLRLAKPSAVVPAAVALPTTLIAGQAGGAPDDGGGGGTRHGGAAAAVAVPVSSGHHEIIAPLTGIFYNSPSPEAAPYLRIGGTVSKGQVIGLIEAMKLFNEIKSDVSGTVHRIVAESGALVKQKQALVEVIPS